MEVNKNKSICGSKELKTLLSNEWFKNLMGIDEKTFRNYLENNNSKLSKMLKYDSENSVINGYNAGKFEILNIGDLILINDLKIKTGKKPIIRLFIRTNATEFSRNHVDVTFIQGNPDYKGALFQVASQFNCLEMSNPYISIQKTDNFMNVYSKDKTQGPRASISAGPGSILRTYFRDGEIKKPLDKNQINLVSTLEKEGYVEVVNGYGFISDKMDKKHKNISHSVRKELIKKADIGLQTNTQVSYKNEYRKNMLINEDDEQLIDQIYVSALAVGYQTNPVSDEAQKLFLDIAYVGTFLAAIHNKNEKMVCTFVGTGAFKNKMILMQKAFINAYGKCAKYSNLDYVDIPFFEPINDNNSTNLTNFVQMFDHNNIQYEIIDCTTEQTYNTSI
jgi:hypothetical protein